jgi:hypothetical protein
MIAMSATAAMASAQTGDTARHGPPIDAAGANSGSTSHPQSGTNMPSTTGMKHTKSTTKKTDASAGTQARHGPPSEAAGANSGTTSHAQSGTNQPATSGMAATAPNH